MTHYEQLQTHIPNLDTKRILDVGAGKGAFIIEACLHGARAEGLELNEENILIARELAARKGIELKLVQGDAAQLPYPDSSFDVVDMAEVIEHVEDHIAVTKEIHRVLVPGGLVYMSVPNRFGFRDQHFHLYFVNWLPRFLSDSFISLFGHHKVYDGSSGLQRLADMHYMTYSGARRFFERYGFAVTDMRIQKLHKRFARNPLLYMLARIAYAVARTVYFDSFHFLLQKKI